MDIEGFRSFMKKKRKTENTIVTCLDAARELETYLNSKDLSIDSFTTEELESFISDHLDPKHVRKYLWSIGYYFLFLERDDLGKAASNIRGQRIKKKRKPFKLKNFRGVDSKDVSELAKLEIHDIDAMLQHGKTPELRMELVAKSGLDITMIEELVKLSDLARIPGVKGIRSRLYHDAGFDTLEKLRNSTRDEVLRITREFVEKTGFEGIAPLPKEAESTIATAKKLPDILEW